MKKCKCEPVAELINNAAVMEKYIENIKRLDEMEKEGILELYAGDSYLNDIEEHCEKEDRYTINHYYRCKKCGRVFFIGFCCRGGFIFKIKEFPTDYAKTIDDMNFEKIMGKNEKLGIRFKNEQRYR